MRTWCHTSAKAAIAGFHELIIALTGMKLPLLSGSQVRWSSALGFVTLQDTHTYTHSVSRCENTALVQAC